MKGKIIHLLLLIALSLTAMKAQVINTQFGPIQGAQNGNVIQFLGVPFAKPPEGGLRWKAPQNPEPWTEVLNTTSFAPECPQKRYEQGETAFTLLGEEDCLYLNIWTPQTGPGDRPVLVFIHGGGNQQGGAGQITGGTHIYFGKNMAERGNAVVVSIQYRLGALGFLAHPGLEQEHPEALSGNYAVLDQILALNWVKNNIADFGGNPGKVMIFGESAGGVNVGNLLTSPLAAGLFQRACIQSASPVISEYQHARNKGAEFVNSFPLAVGSDAEKIAYLRSLPADSIVITGGSPLEGGIVQMNWQPVVDGYVFLDFPLNVFQSGGYNAVPLIIGSNSEEMSLSAPQVVFPFMVSGLINAYLPAGLQSQALALYPPGSSNGAARESYVALLSDAQFTAPARRAAQCISLNQEEPVWRYFFTHKHSIPQLAALGSYHGMELFYVFNTWEEATLGSGPLFSPQDDSVQTAMLRYWVNFADTGNPNGEGLAGWPQYEATSDCYLEIKASPDGTGCGLRTAQCDLWDAAAGFSGCTSVGLEPGAAGRPISIFPNPTDGAVNIEYDFGGEPWFVFIYDMSGRLVFSGRNVKQAKLAGQAPGLYFLLARQKDRLWQARLIKQ